ncbi:MAG TPA: MFS transporter [Pirellulales bacterium]|nr:MFS transporter [Pirellulales bacterium]
MPPPTAAPVQHEVPPEPRAGQTVHPRADGTAFGLPFWCTYVANSLMMVAISLLYRYGDFVSILGGSEVDLGWLVAAGMVGSLLMRLAQGVGIDTYGPRRIWLWSSALFIVSCAGHLWINDARAVPIYLLRILFQTSVAGFFGASITYISGRAPISRMAEVIGTLGTSGFVGMMLGTSLGDHLLTRLDRTHSDHMFEAATLLAILAYGFSWLATRRHPLPVRRRRMPVVWLLKRYHPGAVLWAGVAMGFGLGLPGVFLTRYAATLGIPKLAVFFWVYAPTAFLTRMAIRRMPQSYGIRPMIVLGLGSLALGMLLFLNVQHEWQFVFPAVFIGVAHAFSFPAVVAGGSGVFPIRYRGLGTTLMLAMFDLGNLVGMPAVGEMLYWFGRGGLDRYGAMFISVAGLLAMVAASYAWVERKSFRHSFGSDEQSP